MRIYQLKVSLLYNKRTYRVIEIGENQTLYHLHQSIFEAYDRDELHLYSFFLTRTATKSIRLMYDSPEYTDPNAIFDMASFGDNPKHDAEKTKIRELNLIEKDRFYYLFDFGDCCWHEITVLEIQKNDNSKSYPRIIKIQGVSPALYEFDDDEEPPY